MSYHPNQIVERFVDVDLLLRTCFHILDLREGEGEGEGGKEREGGRERERRRKERGVKK